MNKKIFAAFAAAAVLLASGCGNSKPAETTTAATTAATTAETTTEAVEETEDVTDEGEEDEGSEEDTSDENGSADSDADALSNAWGEMYGYPYNFAGGTAKVMDGNIAIVSVFVTTEEFPWDFNEIMETDAFQYYLNDLNIAVNYLTEKAQEYGKSPNFIWDWSEHEGLCSYSSTDLIDPIKGSGNFGMAWQHITTEIDTAAILKETGAEQILYIFVYNTPPEYEAVGEYRGPYCQTYWNDEAEKETDGENPPDPPYETIFLTMGYYDGQPQYVNPTTVAHEILHAFGADDLYPKDSGKYSYNISQEYIDYINENELNDIMRCPETGEVQNYDSINSEITDITAYYAGLADSSETVDQWGFDKREEYSF